MKKKSERPNRLSYEHVGSNRKEKKEAQEKGKGVMSCPSAIRAHDRKPLTRSGNSTHTHLATVFSWENQKQHKNKQGNEYHSTEQRAREESRERVKRLVKGTRFESMRTWVRGYVSVGARCCCCTCRPYRHAMGLLGVRRCKRIGIEQK